MKTAMTASETIQFLQQEEERMDRKTAREDKVKKTKKASKPNSKPKGKKLVKPSRDRVWEEVEASASLFDGYSN